MNLLCTCLIFGLLKSNFVAARWSTWGAWGHCSVTCGTGTKVSHRTCSHGSCDGSSTKTTSCHPTPHTCPPVDGHWTAWRHWGSCSATCEGTRTRTRVCHPPEHGGAPCRGNTVETSGCGTSHCPVDGYLTTWTYWSLCSATCEGTRKRIRVCHPPQYGGSQCFGGTIDISGCGASHCSVDGKLSDWGSWSQCSATCEGLKSRSRTCSHPLYGGASCDNQTTQTAKCGNEHCPVDGQLSDWGSWSQCSATCEGLKSRSRTCSHPQYGGAPCTGQTTQTAKCGTVNCPGVTCPTCNEILECTWNTSCPMSETCLVRNFPGYKFTTHCIMKDDCEIMKKLQKSQEQIYCCDDESCLQNILGEGRLSDWTSWGQCSATCEGLKSRTRTCNSQQVGDVPCIDVTQTAKCGTEHCPVNGGWSRYTHPTACSVTCGGGVRTFTRTCNNPTPAYGGLQCRGESHWNIHCRRNPCPVNGGWSGWNHPSACSVTCGGGVRTRTRTCNHPTPAYGGQQCRGESHMSEHCNGNPCPVNGVLLAWGDWSPCSVTCGSGSRVRSRACIPPKYGGLNCTGPLFEINNCIQVPCQINGGWSGWNHPSACSVTCGGGERTRTRTCSHPTPAYGGHQCRGESHMSEHCNGNPCPAATCASRMDCNQQNTHATFLAFNMPCPVDHIDCVNSMCFCSIDKITTTPRAASTTTTTTPVPTTTTPVPTTTTPTPTHQTCGCNKSGSKPCVSCDANLNCVLNQTCADSETCMVRGVLEHGFQFSVHCILSSDCHLMKYLSNNTEIYCCDDRSCLQKYLSSLILV